MCSVGIAMERFEYPGPPQAGGWGQKKPTLWPRVAASDAIVLGMHMQNSRFVSQEEVCTTMQYVQPDKGHCQQMAGRENGEKR